MKKITFAELCNIFYKHNEENNVTSQYKDPNSLKGAIVFKQSNFQTEYSLDSRTYLFSSDNKYFIPGMGGNSIFANCKDGTDQGMRLDWYLGEWEIEYCYIVVDKNNFAD